MTREEAIQCIKHELLITVNRKDLTGQAIGEALNMAIQALQTDIVRCGECKHRHNDEYCPMYGLEWHEKEDDEGFFTIEDLTKDDGYCSMGERKESEDNHAD